jgi:hypothetical protein
MLVRFRILVRLAAFLLLAVFAVGAFTWFFALPLEAHYWGRHAAILGQTPAPVRDSTFTESKGRKIAFCGSTFDVPWSDLDDAKTKAGGNSTTLFFGSGLVAILKCEPPREFVEGVLSSIKVSPESFGQAFGDAALSDYGLTRLMLETTPDSMTFRTPDRRQRAIMSILVIKAMATPPADSGIFAIHNDEFDGFQYQDPHASPKSVLMDLFAKDRGLEFQLVFNYHGASAHVSQADINRIIRTVHKIGPYSPISPIKQTSLMPSNN